MAKNGVSIALGMKLLAVFALDLVLVRALPFIPQSPALLFVLAALNVVTARAVILGRPLGAFEYTFLSVGLAMAVVLTAATYRVSNPRMGSLYVLETFYRLARGGKETLRRSSPFDNWLGAAERMVTSSLGLVVATAAGRLAARWGRTRQTGAFERKVTSFLQGMIIGLAAYLVVLTVCYFVSPTLPKTTATGWYARWIGLGVCPALGGLAALWWERSANRPGVDAGPSPAEPPPVSR